MGDSKSEGQGLRWGRTGGVSCTNVQCGDLAHVGSPGSGLCQRKASLPGVESSSQSNVFSELRTQLRFPLSIKNFFLLLAQRDRLGGREGSVMV